MTLQAAKAALRCQTLEARDRLSLEWRVEASLTIERIGAERIDIADGEIVSGFFPIRSEVDIRPLMSSLQKKGARLCLPVVMDRTRLEFRELVRGDDLVETGFGTVGPGPQATVLEPQLMLVPLAAFDSTGHRIGYGAGYYDRAIARLREAGHLPRLIGVAFDVQEVENVPHDSHDIAMPAVLTESGLRQMTRTTVQ
ncbi:MAG: 5-formyltetrahydrofolate cyclo-ligase [Alphaproteobacteria bacterium]|nr:5-formyltetrahydrofolate cyclo-ligase [Alphaproteobacteria bacterium]